MPLWGCCFYFYESTRLSRIVTDWHLDSTVKRAKQRQSANWSPITFGILMNQEAALALLSTPLLIVHRSWHESSIVPHLPLSGGQFKYLARRMKTMSSGDTRGRRHLVPSLGLGLARLLGAAVLLCSPSQSRHSPRVGGCCASCLPTIGNQLAS